MRGAHFFIAALFIAASGRAEVSVSSVSGLVSTGQTLVISGAGFQEKSPAAPILWADFESGIDPSPLGQKAAWDATNNMEATATEGYNGSKGAKASNDTGNWTLGVDNAAWTAEGKTTYIYKRTRQNFIITDLSQNWKTWRMWAESGKPNAYFASNNGRAYVEYIGGESGFWGSFNPNSTDWIIEEIIVKASSAIDIKDGRLAYRVNGQQKSSGTLKTRSTAAPDYMTINYVVHGVLANRGLWSPAWQTTWRTWADNIYVDNTPARVMIGDASTFTASRNLDIQIPTAWADGSVTVVANTVGFVAGQLAYLYVWDKDGNVNSAGFPVTIAQVSSGGDPEDPGEPEPEPRRWLRIFRRG